MLPQPVPLRILLWRPVTTPLSTPQNSRIYTPTLLPVMAHPSPSRCRTKERVCISAPLRDDKRTGVYDDNVERDIEAHEAHEHSDENAYTSEDTSKDAYISEDDDVDTPAELDNDHSSYNDNDNNNDNDGPDDNSQYDGDHKDDHSDGPTTMVKALFSITSSEATTPPPTATRSSIALYSK